MQAHPSLKWGRGGGAGLLEKPGSPEELEVSSYEPWKAVAGFFSPSYNISPDCIRNAYSL